IAEYREIFTDDYRFVFALADTNGQLFRGGVLTREDELASATNLFVGGSASEPPATSINLRFDGNLISRTVFLPDSATVPWPQHRQITTSVALSITAGDQHFEVTG